MRIVTYLADRGARAGLLRGGELIDVWDAIGGEGSSVRELLASGRLDEAESAAEDPIAVDGVELLPPVPDPTEDHLHRPQLPLPRGGGRHRAALQARPSSPSSATRWSRTAQRCRLPSASRKVDFEAEVAFVVGRRCHEVDEAGRARPSRRLHAAQRPLGPRPAVRDAAVDPGQGLRRLGAVRPGAGDAGRGGPARRDRVRARPQRRADAGRLDRRPDLLGRRRCSPTSRP